MSHFQSRALRERQRLRRPHRLFDAASVHLEPRQSADIKFRQNLTSRQFQARELNELRNGVNAGPCSGGTGVSEDGIWVYSYLFP
jgi:hypothetical protein